MVEFIFHLDQVMNAQTCQCETQTLKYLAGQLSGNKISEAEAHIAQCAQCCETMAHLSRLTFPVETVEEKAFLDANIKDSEQTISELIAKNLKTFQNNNDNFNVVEGNFLSNKLSFSQRVKFLALVASLAILLLLGDGNFLFWQNPHLQIIPEKPSILEQINLEGRITEFRFTEFSYSHFTKDRGINSAKQIEELISARLQLETLIKTNPTPRNRQTLAYIFFMLKEYNLAMAELSKAALDSPTNFSIYNDLAIIAATTHDYTTALVYINKALTINPQYVIGIFNRALIYKQIKEYNSARLDLEKYLQLDSSSPWAEEAKNNLAFIKNIS
jgi:tetratricopeptide (TPR) repeat protein